MLSSAPGASSSATLLGNKIPGKTTSEWHDIFEQSLDEDDPLWDEYIQQAAIFDNKMIEDWHKIVDVVLVYVALFTAVLAAFIVQTEQQFAPNPSDVTNQLLVALYKNQLASLEGSPPYIIDTAALFRQDPSDYRQAFISNALLFVDLAVTTIVSTIALFAKLWLINYHNRVNSTGSQYERAMRRQEAYSGLVAWKLGAVIEALPLFLLVAVLAFGLFIYQSIRTDQPLISSIVIALLTLAVFFFFLVTICGAFIPDCPYKTSLLSNSILLIFKPYPNYTDFREEIINTVRNLKMSFRVVQNMGMVVFPILILVGTPVLVIRYSYAFAFFFTIPVTAAFSFLGQPPKLDQRPPIYGVRHLAILGGLVISPVGAMAAAFNGQPHIFTALYGTASLLLALGAIVGTRLYKFVPDTLEAEAVAWLLNSTWSQKLSIFKTAGKIAEGSEPRKALLLTSLLPHLQTLITSHNRRKDSAESQTQALEIYVSCLAQLSTFTDSEQSIWRNEAAMMHPTLPHAEPLHEILRNLERSPNPRLSSAAKDILRMYTTRVEEKMAEEEPA